MNLTEKSSYVKGLADGMKVTDDDNTGKLLLALIDVIDDMALTISDLEDSLDLVSEQVDAIDEDLDELEEYVFCDEDDDFCGCCDCEDDELYEVECPSCGEEIYLDDEMLDEEFIECPACGEKLELDIEFDDCDCGCDCCDCDEE